MLKKERERKGESFFIISTIILSPRIISVRNAAFIIGRKDVGIPQWHDWTEQLSEMENADPIPMLLLEASIHRNLRNS